MSDYDVTTVDTTYRPQMTTAEAIEVYREMREFVAAILAEGRDFGIIPGTNKPTLLKAGAEKLCRFFGLSASMTLVDKVEDWTGADRGAPLFAYVYRCALSKNGIIIAECDGQANTWESRYGKQRQQPYALINTVMKQSQKRAFVGATLLACNASEYFTQDLDDIESPPAAAPQRQRRKGGLSEAIKYLHDKGILDEEIVAACGFTPTENDVDRLRQACRDAQSMDNSMPIKTRLLEALYSLQPCSAATTEVDDEPA